MVKKAAVLVVSCGALLTGCGTDADPPSENEEIISNLSKIGYPTDGIRVVEGAVYVGNDAQVTLEASQEMVQREGSKEQYRTTNLVGASVTRICLNPTATFNSYSLLSQGLDLAIINYNVLGLRLTFVRGPATGCTANISVRTMAGAGGSSGFPSGGLPYPTINIGTGLQSYSVDVSEHVITHQLGHTLGLHHTDLSSPSSCSNHGTGGVGAIPIPGTPTSDPLSIMNTCFSSSATGEFSNYDRVALNYLY